MKLSTTSGARSRRSSRSLPIGGKSVGNGIVMTKAGTFKRGVRIPNNPNAYRDVARHFEQAIGTALTFTKPRGRR